MSTPTGYNVPCRRSGRCSHEARRHPPHHGHHRRRAAQRRLLRARARAADGQEDGQPGRPDRLPPLLRRRARLRRRRPDVLRVPERPPGPRRARAWSHRIAHRVASAETLDFWEDRLGSEGVEAMRAVDGALRFADPEGLEHELVVVDVPRRTAARPLHRGPGRACAARLPRGRRGGRRPAQDRGAAARHARLPGARRPRVGGARRPARRLDPPRAPPPAAASAARARSTTSPGRRRSTSTAPGASTSPPPATRSPRSSIASISARSTSASRAGSCSSWRRSARASRRMSRWKRWASVCRCHRTSRSCERRSSRC